MLPGATVPCSLTDLVAVFRPCFTPPAFRTFIGLVVGLIGQTGLPKIISTRETDFGLDVRECRVGRLGSC